jgi:riboflavin synthase
VFTGIVETTGQVKSCRFSPGRRSLVLGIRAIKVSKNLKIGGSLSVNGVCLTIIRKSGNCLFFNVVRETLRRSTLSRFEIGEKVNLERPMKLNGRLEGHIVLGHVDSVGSVIRITKKGREKDFLISFPATLKPYILEKGSIAVDGVSLTLGKIMDNRFWVHCIPHTLKSTNFDSFKKGVKVNLEADVLTKLAAKQFEARRYILRTGKRSKVD